MTELIFAWKRRPLNYRNLGKRGRQKAAHKSEGVLRVQEKFKKNVFGTKKEKKVTGVDAK